jgi:hypothetical protein
VSYAEIRALREKRLQELGFDSYRSYCRSEHWKDRRDEILDRFDVCYCCGHEYGRGKMLVHHCDYSRLGREPIKHLIVLCKDCHAFLHNLVDDDVVELDVAHVAVREMNVIDRNYADRVSKRKWFTYLAKWDKFDRTAYRMGRRRWLRMRKAVEEE